MSDAALKELVASPETPGSKNFPPFAPSAELEAEAARRLAQFPDDQQRSAVLPILHFIQHHHGFLSAEAIQWTSDRLGIEPIKVLEVVTFYPGFRQSAPGKFHIRVCRTLSCAMGGSYQLMERLCELTGIDHPPFSPPPVFATYFAKGYDWQAGPATGSFNGLHAKSKFLAAIRAKKPD